jgi:hypothetical protein
MYIKEQVNKTYLSKFNKHIVKLISMDDYHNKWFLFIGTRRYEKLKLKKKNLFQKYNVFISLVGYYYQINGILAF